MDKRANIGFLIVLDFTLMCKSVHNLIKYFEIYREHLIRYIILYQINLYLCFRLSQALVEYPNAKRILESQAIER